MCFTSHLYAFFREMSIQVLRSLFIKLFCLVTLTFKLPGISFFFQKETDTCAYSSCSLLPSQHMPRCSPCEPLHPDEPRTTQEDPPQSALGMAPRGVLPYTARHICRHRGPAFTTHELNLKFKFPSYSGSPLPGTHSLCLPQVLNALTDLYIRP